MNGIVAVKAVSLMLLLVYNLKFPFSFLYSFLSPLNEKVKITKATLIKKKVNLHNENDKNMFFIYVPQLSTDCVALYLIYPLH